jgi:carboxymethylenebutenolidase
MGQYIDLQAADGLSIPAYLARPAGAARGAVVVAQEIFGVNQHIREVASTFHRVQAGVELGYTEADMKEGQRLRAAVEALPAPGVLQDLQAAVDYAAQASGGKVGVVGYCWGGLLAWRAASRVTGLSAAVPYYGGGMTQPQELAAAPRVPVMAHLSDNDAYVPMDGVAALKKAHPAVQVHIYPARHGFNCDHRAAYNAEAAQLARERTLAFLGEHLG